VSRLIETRQLLRVDVDELAGCLSLIAILGLRRVERAQLAQADRGAGPLHAGLAETQHLDDTRLTEFEPSQCLDSIAPFSRKSIRTRLRT